MSRGYCAIALHQPKSVINIGSVYRLCGNYGVSFLVIDEREGADLCYRDIALGKICTDTGGVSKHIPTISTNDLFLHAPRTAEIVGVEMTDSAVSLCDFAHSERSYYIFGSEDKGLPEDILEKCSVIVRIPTQHSLNLAVTVGTVLYSRLKQPLRKIELSRLHKDYGGTQ